MEVRGNPAGPNIEMWRGWADDGDTFAEDLLETFERTVAWANELSDRDAELIDGWQPGVWQGWEVGSHFPLPMLKNFLEAAKLRAEATGMLNTSITDLMFNCPPLDEVQRRMKEILTPGTREGIVYPAHLEGTPFAVDYEGPYSVGHLFELRPDREATRQTLIDQIGQLPMAVSDEFWGNGGRREWPTPQVIAENAPFQTYFLAPDMEDSIEDNGEVIGLTRQTPWTYLDRTITPLYGRNSYWEISGGHPAFSWVLSVDRGGNREYSLSGEIKWVMPDAPAGWVPVSSHPERLDTGIEPDPNAPSHERPDDLRGLYISGTDVYGSAWLSIKKLGYFGSLEVAINWIDCLEYAYGVADRPHWLT